MRDERRARLVEELRAAPDGRDAQDLAARLGLRANTVRWHLGVLADAGLVESQPAPRPSPGRPRILYRLTGKAATARSDEYRLLATILTGAVSELDDGPHSAEAAGSAWGRYLVRRPPPHVQLGEDEAVGEVVELLDAQGFAPEAHVREIHMHRCPFHDLAESHPEIVCAVHRGVVSGALDELGSELEVEGLDVFARPDLCIARLAPR